MSEDAQATAPMLRRQSQFMIMVERDSVEACVVMRVPADVSDSQAARWQTLMEKSDWPHFYQGPDWFRSYQRQSGYFAVATTRHDEFVGLSVIRERKVPLIAKTKFFIDGGPIATDMESFDIHLRQLTDLLGDSAIWIRVAPYVTSGDRDLYEKALIMANYIRRNRSMGYSATAVLDLSPSLSEIRRKFRRSLKTQLNKSERLGIEVSPADTPESFAAFMHELNKAKGNPPGRAMGGMDSDALYRNFISHPAKGTCIVARLGGQVLAGILVLAAGERVVYQWGYSNKLNTGRAPLSHRLHWEAIKWAKDRGFTKYDLGGYWLERGDADPINRFKTGFTRQIDELCGEFQLTLAPFAGAVANSAEQVRKKISRLRYRAAVKRAGSASPIG